jgi:feruloyl-CoA synthase
MARHPTFLPPDVLVDRRGDGTVLLSSRHALGSYERTIGDMLVRAAAKSPSRDYLLERAGEELRRVTYVEALSIVRSLAAALLSRGLDEQRPLLILSENSIDHALLALAAMHVGIPVVPVSPAYSLLSSDFAKLRHIFGLVAPGAVFAEDGARFASALALAEQLGAEVIVSKNAPKGMRVVTVAELSASTISNRVDARFAALTPDSIAKILFTSGSTGMPKGVLNTQRMLTSNQAMIRTVWPFLTSAPPVVVDWLPWSHTFGGNHNAFLVLANQGTLMIDEGRPVPGMIEKTVRNLREIPPTLYFNVPRGFDALLPFLENDEELRSRFFERLDLLFYAAAALPQSSWERLAQVSVAARGDEITMVSAWGSTETSPLVTSVHFPISAAGNIGVPAPGTVVKLAPLDGKLELRVKGPNVTPGYYAREAETAAAFDEEGFFRMGDAGKLLDESDANRGIAFDGRLAENFKLSTGTWVNVGELRVSLLAAAAPLVQDAVITGHDRDFVGALLFLDAGACERATGLPRGSSIETLAADPALRDRLITALAKRNRQTSGATRTVARCLILIRPASLDLGEITDKGYLNQRALLTTRSADVDELHREPVTSRVMVIA